MKNLILNSIRIRPPKTDKECVEILPSQGLLWIKDEQGAGGHYSKLSGFNHVYSEESTQEQIYHDCARPMVQRFLNGINASVLTYGQTGSGKKYTLGISFEKELEQGFNENTGIIPRSITDIFNYLKEEQEQNPQIVYTMKMSFLTIIQEEFIDLLVDNRPKSQLRSRSPNPLTVKANSLTNPNILVRDLGKKGIVLTGIKDEKILSVDSLLDRIVQGWRNRNSLLDKENRTRAHTILTLYLTREEENQVRSSKLHFAHLAGSEKPKRSIDRSKELGPSIGLLTLSKVLESSNDKQFKGYIPYRESKLTHMMQDCINQNGSYSIISNVSSDLMDYLETRNTVRFIVRSFKNLNDTSIITAQEGVRTQLAKLSEELHIVKNGKNIKKKKF